jgi:hypothetical protein
LAAPAHSAKCLEKVNKLSMRVALCDWDWRSAANQHSGGDTHSTDDDALMRKGVVKRPGRHKRKIGQRGAGQNYAAAKCLCGHRFLSHPKNGLRRFSCVCLLGALENQHSRYGDC